MPPSPTRRAGRSRPDPAHRGRLWRWGGLLLLLVGLGVATGRTVPGGESTPLDLRYSVQIARPSEGILDVELQIDGLERSVLHLGFSPNSVARTAPVSKFRVREVLDADGQPLTLVREPGLWSVRHPGPRVRVRYDVHLEGAGGSSDYSEVVLSRLDAEGGRLLGSDVFLFPDRDPIDDIRVDWELPEGWKLIHPFQDGETSARPPGLPSLYHSAVAVGPYRNTRRVVEGCEIVLALQGRFAFGDGDLMRVVENLVRHQVQRFGPPHRSRYVFVVNEHPRRDDPRHLHYFGLHFDGSMIVLLDPRTDRRELRSEPASLCAHEFFHNWLGELLRQEHYAMNWFVEGVTTWYAYQSLIETRMLDPGRYGDELRERHERDYLGSSLRRRLSVADAGRRVLQDRETTRLLYSGGLFVAVTLDEAIGAASRQEADLEELLDRLFRRARQDPGFRLTRATLEEELAALTGEDFGPWLDRHVYGTEELPLPGYVTAR